MQEEVLKIKGRAGFTFKGFLTEKERIVKFYLRSKNISINRTQSGWMTIKT